MNTIQWHLWKLLNLRSLGFSFDLFGLTAKKTSSLRMIMSYWWKSTGDRCIINADSMESVFPTPHIIWKNKSTFVLQYDELHYHNYSPDVWISLADVSVAKNQILVDFVMCRELRYHNFSPDVWISLAEVSVPRNQILVDFVMCRDFP